MKQILYFMFSIILCSTFVSCSSSEDEPEVEKGLTGWYVCKSTAAKEVDFDPINVAIENDELLYSTRYNDYYATRDLFFFDNGMWYDSDHKHGRFRFSISNYIFVIRIVDDTTLIEYSASLYDKNSYGTENEDIVYKIYAGSIFGELFYCAEGRMLTYTRIEDKIITSEADIYTIVDGGLVEEGHSMSDLMEKYDPTKTYGKNEDPSVEYNRQLQKLVSDNVDVTASYSDYIWKFKITSTLHNELPNSDIKFGIGHGYLAGGTESVSVENQAYSYSCQESGNKMIINFENPFWFYQLYGGGDETEYYGFYYESYKSIRSKNYSSLTDEEKNFLSELINILNEGEKKSIANYKPGIYVIIDDKYFLVERYNNLSIDS